MRKFILILNGPVCAGKSSVTKLFMQKDNIFHGSYDATKWLISNYSPDIELHRKVTKEIVFSAVSKAIQFDFSFVIDGGNIDFRDRYKELANKNGYMYLSVNIEAPLEILEKRFLERVESAKQSKSKRLAITTLEEFNLRYKWYLSRNKDPEGIILDSSKLTPEEIQKEIEGLIGVV